MVRSEESFFKYFPCLSWPSHGLPERIGGLGIESMCFVTVFLANNREAKLEGEIAASGEGDQGNEPLDQSQETSRLLQRLRVKWHFYGSKCSI